MNVSCRLFRQFPSNVDCFVFVVVVVYNVDYLGQFHTTVLVFP